MKTEEEIDDILNRYRNQICWLRNVIQDVADDAMMSEGSAGRHFNMLINLVCGIRPKLPRTTIDLKSWMGGAD